MQARRRTQPERRLYARLDNVFVYQSVNLYIEIGHDYQSVGKITMRVAYYARAN